MNNNHFTFNPFLFNSEAADVIEVNNTSVSRYNQFNNSLNNMNNMSNMNPQLFNNVNFNQGFNPQNQFNFFQQQNNNIGFNVNIINNSNTNNNYNANAYLQHTLSIKEQKYNHEVIENNKMDIREEEDFSILSEVEEMEENVQSNIPHTKSKNNNINNNNNNNNNNKDAGRSNKRRITLNDLPSLLNDPNSFINTKIVNNGNVLKTNKDTRHNSLCVSCSTFPSSSFNSITNKANQTSFNNRNGLFNRSNNNNTNTLMELEGNEPKTNIFDTLSNNENNNGRSNKKKLNFNLRANFTCSLFSKNNTSQREVNFNNNNESNITNNTTSNSFIPPCSFISNVNKESNKAINDSNIDCKLINSSNNSYFNKQPSNNNDFSNNTNDNYIKIEETFINNNSASKDFFKNLSNNKITGLDEYTSSNNSLNTNKYKKKSSNNKSSKKFNPFMMHAKKNSIASLIDLDYSDYDKNKIRKTSTFNLIDYKLNDNNNDSNNISCFNNSRHNTTTNASNLVNNNCFSNTNTNINISNDKSMDKNRIISWHPSFNDIKQEKRKFILQL